MELVKSQLNTLLREWKLCNFDLIKIEKIPPHTFRVCDTLVFIWLSCELMKLQHVAEHEHHIFMIFEKASTPPEKSNTLVLSLAVGEHFIHSYHFRYQLGQCDWGSGIFDSAIFLILIMYLKYNNTYFLETCTSRDIMHDYLSVSCTL